MFLFYYLVESESMSSFIFIFIYMSCFLDMVAMSSLGYSRCNFLKSETELAPPPPNWTIKIYSVLTTTNRKFALPTIEIFFVCNSLQNSVNFSLLSGQANCTASI